MSMAERRTSADPSDELLETDGNPRVAVNELVQHVAHPWR